MLLRDLEPVYDLPRIEETWPAGEWKQAIGGTGVSNTISELVDFGRVRTFAERRMSAALMHETLKDEGLSEKQLHFSVRVWTMPDHVLETLSNTTPRLLREAGRSR